MTTFQHDSIAVYPLTSVLHDESAVAGVTAEFLGALGLTDCLHSGDFAGYGTHDVDLIYVRTGGTEGLFRDLLPRLQAGSARPVLLLAGDKGNSLPASLEILSYLRQQGIAGEVVHGSADYVSRRIALLQHVGRARRYLSGLRLGVVGAPSDWLIASVADADAVRERLGIELVKIPMVELQQTIAVIVPQGDAALEAKAERADVRNSVAGAMAIFEALRHLIAHHGLQGLTLRCFDLLSSVHNTGCLALARLNTEGVLAGCEGDVPTLLSMAVARAVAGTSAFQANPARIDPESGEILFAHCTIPFDMVERFELDTHFESGIGVGIRGFMPAGPVTVVKLSGDVSRHFVAEGELLRCEGKADLCRTQMVVRLSDPAKARYFLTDPIGNHHVIVAGQHAAEIEALLG